MFGRALKLGHFSFDLFNASGLDFNVPIIHFCGESVGSLKLKVVNGTGRVEPIWSKPLGSPRLWSPAIFSSLRHFTLHCENVDTFFFWMYMQTLVLNSLALYCIDITKIIKIVHGSLKTLEVLYPTGDPKLLSVFCK